jgi:hypothetical protein
MVLGDSIVLSGGAKPPCIRCFRYCSCIGTRGIANDAEIQQGTIDDAAIGRGYTRNGNRTVTRRLMMASTRDRDGTRMIDREA